LRVGVVVVGRGKWETGGRAVLGRVPELVTVKTRGEGVAGGTQDGRRDLAAARAAWGAAKELIRDPSYTMVLLDELNIVLRYDYLPIDEVVDFLTTEKPEMTHVVVTGRNAKEPLIEAADLVTEMTMVKHPFRSGVKAQVGVEF